ncbi:hypothetical protein N7474_004372 [Penicillium riverlandense]|uniref:uncharacterized protein n=1 Tax=Penicillium riverlandense TaxID=1903569 RepID=UPI002549B006|nr:uncharacterized protein N7474_004372 [Penicillium riverlandense]KAJ5818781.1 hypothetical protein N7474_004372 [Penicillium riverlandense]
MISRRHKPATTRLAQLRFSGTLGYADRHSPRMAWHQRLASRPRLDILADPSLVAAEPPQVNLPHVDTQLNMHQYNGFFEDGAPAADGLRGGCASPQLHRPLTPLRITIDSHTSPTIISNPSMSPDPSNNTTEWSAVGHAATGKSGRVIHNLQEEIARLTRECSLYRSRAEETQRSNETLKIQVENMGERVRNLEQVNETNLISIARKDRKLDELRAEIQSERTKRQEADLNASKTNQTMREERETHNREQARAHEIAKYHETQYEVLVGTTKREKEDFSRRVKAIWKEVDSMAVASKTRDFSAERMDVIAEQKNREVEVLRDAHEKLMAKHASYKKTKDEEFRDTLERAKANNALIDAALESMKETQAQMRWAIQLNEKEKEKENKESG